jgi:predicted ester cyclase
MGDAKAVADAFLEAFNAHDEARIRELNGENAVFEGPGDVRLEGREAVTEYAMSWLNAFGDARTTVHDELVAGNWVVQEFVFEGTHTAPLQTPAGEVPATNRQLRGRGVQILRIEGDTIVDTRLYYDQVQLMTQLGLMPEPVAATS